MPELISFDHYLTILNSPLLREQRTALYEHPFVCVDWADADALAPELLLPNCPVIAIGADAETPGADICLDTIDEFQAIEHNLANQASACATLVQLLRHNARASIGDGLFAESLAYSTLQQSAGFQSWLKAPRRAHKADTEPTVLCERSGTSLTITLNRPHAHNAYSMNLKDELCAVLQAASEDSALKTLTLQGAGPSYCAGGDLSEFGQVDDATTAHLSRTTRSAGALLAGLSCHTHVMVQGACIGAGIEIPAFADRITARAESYFQLPEISMGLVPGAGGTVSITRKIGRHKTAYLAISNERIDAATALAWGLIEAVTE